MKNKVKTVSERLTEWLAVIRSQNPVVIADDVRKDITRLIEQRQAYQILVDRLNGDNTYLRQSLEAEKRRALKYRARLNNSYIRNEKSQFYDNIRKAIKILNDLLPEPSPPPMPVNKVHGWPTPKTVPTVSPAERVTSTALHSSHMLRDAPHSPSGYACDLCGVTQFVKLYTPCEVEKL